ASDLLLRPGASATWDLPAAPRQGPGSSGDVELAIELAFLAGETQVPLGGTVELGDARIGTIDPSVTEGPAETRTFRFAVRLGGVPAPLSLSPVGFDVHPLFLRIRSIRLFSKAPTQSVS
ncbi:MAG: hypothetical protein AAGG01_04910, partial [Planctomycetota bacterium]